MKVRGCTGTKLNRVMPVEENKADNLYKQIRAGKLLHRHEDL